MDNILNNKFINLDDVSSEYHHQYSDNKPFPHIIFDNFFKQDFLENILEDFPKDLQKTGIKFDDKQEKKIASKNSDIISDKTNTLINFLNSYKFLNFLNNLSGIQETLIPDPYLWGGGYHELKNGGYLNVHADFNVHPQLHLNRRVNLLIYLNKDWNKNYGGSLEFWDKDMFKCVRKIVPTFNKIVIFNTNDFSYHGNPETINNPHDISRKSIALYYYSNGRPKTDAKDEISHNTIFQKRPNSPDETRTQIVFKKIFGKFYIRNKIKR